MRRVGLTLAALLAAAPAVFAQGPPATTPVPLPTPGAGGGVPAIPVGNTPNFAPPAAAAGVDPVLKQHLDGWERVMGGTTNFRADFETTRTEVTFGKKQEYTGSVLCMKPNLARLRLVDKNNPANYEAYICSGKAVYHYDGSRKTMTQHLIDPAMAAGGDNLMLDFLSGMKAQQALDRFEMSLFKAPDQFYVYLLIKPRYARDKQEFEEVRFAIYGANLNPTLKHLSYLPSQVFMKKPNGDTEVWKFKNPQTNLPGVDAKVFQYEAPPQGWSVQNAPAPGGNPAPAPGGLAPRPMK